MARGHAAASTTGNQGGGSVLGRGARVRGRLSGDGDLRVEGQIEGDVSVSGELGIDDDGRIDGSVEAAAVTVAGAVHGDITARGVITIRAGAKVDGNVSGGEFVLEEGAAFTGRLDMEFDLPAELMGRPARG